MLRDHRLAQNLTLEELAKRCGVSRVSLNRYELGVRTPSVTIAQKIASALGCSVGDIFPEKQVAEKAV